MNGTARNKAVPEAIRVLVADDTRLHTQLLADALKLDDSLEVTRSDSPELIVRADLRNIDILLLSSESNQPAGGFAISREVHASHPNVRVVILLDSTKSESILEAFRSGARGVLSRQDSIEVLSKCVRSVHQGQIWANSQQIELLVDALAASHKPSAVNAQGMAQLTKREAEVVTMVGRGLTNREISAHLRLSEHTVKNYLFRIYDKLGVSSRVELLYVTLSRESLESSASSFRTNDADQDLQSASILAGYQRAAEQGVSAAQLELARYYWTRRSDSRDLIQAYKWYRIATRQLSRTTENVARTLTKEQLLQAEQMAAEWLKKPGRPSLTSIRELDDRPVRAALRAASE